jgi:hypothetical protein
MPNPDFSTEKDNALRAALRAAIRPAIITRLDEVCERSRLSVREILEQAIDFAWHVQLSRELDRGPDAPADGGNRPPEAIPQRYNGWDNYETWAVNLWLTNEEGIYNYCRGLALRAAIDAPTCEQVREGIWTVEEAKRFLLADQLKSSVEDMNPLADKATMFTDLLHAAISEVNWDEIATAFLDDAADPDTAP